MAVLPLALAGSLFTSACLSLGDVTGPSDATVVASVLKVTTPTEYPVGKTLSRKSAAVCRILSSRVTSDCNHIDWQLSDLYV